MFSPRMGEHIIRQQLLKRFNTQFGQFFSSMVFSPLRTSEGFGLLFGEVIVVEKNQLSIHR